MATSLIRTCLKRNFLKSSLCDVFGNDRSIKSNIVVLDVITLQCSYHNTPVLLKRRKTVEERKVIYKLKELEMLNAKPKAETKVIDAWNNMTVKELALATGHSVDDILDAVFFIDPQTTYNRNSIFGDLPTLMNTVHKLGLKCKIVKNPKEKDETEAIDTIDVCKRPPPHPSVTVKRRPVVTIMGHVDHGKTTLLDSLRHTSVVDSEFGGITQHIGAFNVKLSNGDKITFLDTPGHAAFSTMRARGANVTDIVVLVVAADDGVMEQTIQSIEMAKTANVPIIVAINKIDKPDINIPRTYQMLSDNGIFVEAIGGNVQSINISALKGTNLDQLMDAISVQAEIMDLRGDPTGMVEGVVIEASNDPGRGKLATALIQRGTLRKGDVLVSGLAWAKVRAMFDDTGTLVPEATLSDAVQIIGWRELPVAGEEILEVESEKKAHIVMKHRHAKVNEIKAIEQQLAADAKHREHLIEYEKLVQKKRLLGVKRLKRDGPRQKEIIQDDFPKVNVIIKGDVVGSVEAILDVLDTYNDEKRCRLSVVHYGVGQITETDLELADTFNAVIYSFNTKVPKTLSQKILEKKIPIRYHTVIYRLVDDLKEEINKQLPLIQAEEEIGEAVVLQEFDINVKRKKVKVAGCRCTKGSLLKSQLFKVMRDDQVIYRGKVSTMRHLKADVDSIKNNTECGIKFEDTDIEFKPQDKIICYKLVDKTQQTNWNPGF